MARVGVAEEDLRTALIALKKEHPTLGVAKIHALLLETYPTWAASEKRVRKILQSKELVDDAPIHPVSRLNQGLDVTRWSSKLKVHYFDSVKGKGLVATEKISEGEVVWKEDPFVLAPEWDIYDLQTTSRACAHCSTLLGDPSPRHMRCSASASACPAVFCSRLCRARSERVHPLLCPVQNPASIALLAFARSAEWMALHALAQCTSRLLISGQKEDGWLEEDVRVVEGLAALGMEERFRALRVEPDRESWKKGHRLFVCAFHAPRTSDEQKRLGRILKKPVTIGRDTFAYDGFLRGLGRMSLNLEAHGGLYALHSHLNHACTPNVSVRHFDRHTALSRITLVARSDIEPGQELLITYVDPRCTYDERQKRLLEWGFGPCRCDRCLAERGDAGEPDDLADQLRAGLGLA